MAKVKTNKSFEFGKTRVTSVETLEFDDQGISQEISNEDAALLVKASPSLTLVQEQDQLPDPSLNEEGDVGNKKLDETPLIKEVKQEAIKPKAEVTDAIVTDAADVIEVKGEVEIIEDVVEGDKVEVVETALDDAITPTFTKEQLGEMGMGDLRDALIKAGVAEIEVEKYKGREMKDELVDFAFSKL